MSPPVFNPKHKEVLDSVLLQMPGVVAGTMFGYPAYYINKKLFACLYEEGVGIKVPAQGCRFAGWPERNCSFPAEREKTDEGMDPD